MKWQWWTRCSTTSCWRIGSSFRTATRARTYLRQKTDTLKPRKQVKSTSIWNR